MNTDIFAQLPGVLLPWYRENKRDLPWRQDRDPYHIWVSEIMLQQTRVEAVKGYYSRFLKTLPDIAALAKCDDEVLHKLWEGLGYYSRVRNLKKAAQEVQSRFGGVFPQAHRDVLSLPGIGSYTAGAICSIAFDAPTPAVDGNVLRVVARLTDDAAPIDSPAFKASVEERLARVYPPQAGAFTQALMELGATLCGPNRKPDCESCPCHSFCLGHLRKTTESLPVKSPKRQRRQEDRTVFIFSYDGAIALEKRPERGLLAGLWQFPNISGKPELKEALAYLEEQGLKPRQVFKVLNRSHVFTHIQWDMQGIYLELGEQGGGYTWMTPERIKEEAALPTAFRQFLEETE